MMTTDIFLWLLAIAFLAACLVLGFFVLATRRLAKEAERRVPASGRFVSVAGNRLHYVEAGRGRPILFLHGLGGQLHHFRHTLFDRLAGDFRLIALDRPGSGYSVRARGASGKLGEQAALVAAFIEELGLEKPLVVGHSLGGGVALALALDHPETVSGLALLSPVTHQETAAPPQFSALSIRSPLKLKLLAHTTAIPMALKRAPQTLAFVFGPQAAGDDYIVGGGGILGLRPRHFEATVTDFVALEHEVGRYESRLEELEMPVGVLFGTADQVIRHEDHALPLAGRIKNFELELVEGVGHMPQFASPDRVEVFVRRMAERAFR
ncbi:alpha/beta fold hydrolase [Mesorhizobium sp. LHD-90]|uniref:alpha/beta fold hydrolase n=1 Tax=Mesorhizobium sp. LHD-90 TaxID=3071414 RepID=UPI0027DF1AC7|nr:alpha/beta fold hydrolase [Mesorhizobium sp. LHD-90]MDQ6433072.1 alpha/beta fold hydrolase [Mesorhizobium sp. LHD-90]